MGLEENLPKNKSSPLKTNAWKINCPFGMAYFQDGSRMVLGNG